MTIVSSSTTVVASCWFGFSSTSAWPFRGSWLCLVIEVKHGGQMEKMDNTTNAPLLNYHYYKSSNRYSLDESHSCSVVYLCNSSHREMVLLPEVWTCLDDKQIDHSINTTAPTSCTHLNVHMYLGV